MMRKRPLILIVEDNPASRDIMQARLVANNYDVLTAEDGERGLEQARENLPDLILLDIMMPKMDGLEVCRCLKSDKSLPFMPIIMITAKTDPKDVVAGLEAGGDEYLAKPVDHRSLLARVRSMLRIKELHDMVLVQSDQLKRQLRTANKVQSLFWPKIPKLSRKRNIWAFSEPAQYVAGDLYDIIPLSDESWLVYVADVAGKGVAAALIMAALSTMIRSETPFHHNVEELIKIINKKMYSLCADEGYFATILLIRYWPESGRLQLLRAGHPTPLWVSGGTIVPLPQLPGIALGITENSSFEAHDITLSAGDTFLLYSDGVIEAENDTQELFGYDKLQECVLAKDGPPFAREVVEAVNTWRGSAEINDDLTIVEVWHRED